MATRKPPPSGRRKRPKPLLAAEVTYVEMALLPYPSGR